MARGNERTHRKLNNINSLDAKQTHEASQCKFIGQDERRSKEEADHIIHLVGPQPTADKSTRHGVR